MRGLESYIITLILLMLICSPVLPLSNKLLLMMVKFLKDLPVGCFFRRYCGKERELAIYRYCEHDNLRDACNCIRYYECGIIEPCVLCNHEEVYQI